MLTLLLVVGGKLFMVQGLDVGGMAAAALNNRMRETVLPAERGSILDANGTVLANSVIRYNVVVDQTVNTKTETFKRLRKSTARTNSLTSAGTRASTNWRLVLGMDKDDIREAVTGESRYYIVAKDLKPDVEDQGLEAADPRHRHRGRQQTRLPQRFRGRRNHRLPPGRHTRARPASSRPRMGCCEAKTASGSSRSVPTACGFRSAWMS